MEHLNPEEKKALLDLCYEFEDIAFLEGDILSATDTIEHNIELTDDKPIFAKTYRYPHVHREEVERQIDDMLKQNIIEPSKSPFSSPLWVVPKKIDASGKQKWRIVVDYRLVNEKTIGDRHPLPNITEILDQLGHSKYFTSLDLKSGFHQIKLSEKDKHKTAFSGPGGHYQFLRMPFGLKNAPATFARLVNVVLSGIQGIKCFVYLDDIVIYGSSLKDHMNKLRSVFERLREHNLKIELDKCEFLRKELSYLGHLITCDGVRPNPQKIESITNYPTPKSTKDIKAFLGISGYYRRFIESYAKIAAPLTKLLKKGEEFKWTQAQEDSFNLLKSKLTQGPILSYPDFNKEFQLTTDASGTGIGAILSQDDKVISYASRTLNKAEIKYSTIEKECLAIVWAVRYFRPYLYGRKFKVLSDHKPLQYIFNIKDPGSRLVRWRLKLMEYDFDISYKPGKSIPHVDALSRIVNEDNFISVKTLIAVVDSCPYDEFLREIEKKVVINKHYEEISSQLNTKDNILICIPKNLDKNLDASILNFIKNKNHKRQLEKAKLSIGDVHVIRDKFSITYYCVTKEYAWDKPEYHILFNILSTVSSLVQKHKINSLFFISIFRRKIFKMA